MGNKYKVLVGDTKGDVSLDNFGWIQWYIEYQQGRRIEKYDQKQIDYWASIASAETGYIRYLLIKQIKEAGDQSVYNLTMFEKHRQILLEFGYQITKEDYFKELEEETLEGYFSS